MKRTLFVIILILFIYKDGFSQVQPLIGKTDKEVREYFTALFKTSTNKSLAIKESSSPSGDMILTASFPLLEENSFSCLSIIALFNRINTVELCVRMAISGTDKTSQVNLAYIKDNFEEISSGKWSKPLKGMPFEIIADFNKLTTGGYGILYNLKEIK